MQEQKANELSLLSAALMLVGLVVFFSWRAHPTAVSASAFFALIISSIAVSTIYAKSVLNLVGRIGIVIGALLNAVVIVANGGKMPFIAPGLEAELSVWTPATASTKLLFLADIHPFHNLVYYSIGDVFIVVSAVLVALGLVSEYRMSRRVSSLESTAENQ